MKKLLIATALLLAIVGGNVFGQTGPYYYTGTVTSIEQRATAHTNNAGSCVISFQTMPTNTGFTVGAVYILVSDASYKSLLASLLSAKTSNLPITITYVRGTFWGSNNTYDANVTAIRF